LSKDMPEINLDD